MNKEYEVIVAGGGTAGVVAALACARMGVKTLLIEQSGALGGVASTGMPWGGMFNSEHKQVIFGLPDELIKKAVSMGALGYVHYGSDDGHNWISALGCVDSEIARLLFREELNKAGCDVLLYSAVYAVKTDGGIITGLSVCTRSGNVRVRGHMFIDCTGDATIADMSGVEWERGEGENRQCVSSLIRISGIDLKAFKTYMNEVVNVDNWSQWDYSDAPTRGGFTYWCPWKDNEEFFQYPPQQLGLIWSGFGGDVYLNCTNADVDCLDALSLSNGEYHIRKQTDEIFRYFRQYVPGFEKSFLSHVYDIGVRESRRILGKYKITKQDLLLGNHFDDVIGVGAYPLDHHAKSGKVQIHTHEDVKSQRQSSDYEIPYGSMVNEKVENLIVAGRCISCTFEAQAALRGIGPCMVEGEAVGRAAALAVTNGQSFLDLNVEQLQILLLQSGVYLKDTVKP